MTGTRKDENPTAADAVIAAARFNDRGLVAAIAQDAQSGAVLMLAWMNADAIRATLTEGRAVYWSRSRGELWRKGETSGHVQKLKELRLDCDGDAILMQVEQTGAACHTGAATCFYRLAEGEGLRDAPDPRRR